MRNCTFGLFSAHRANCIIFGLAHREQHFEFGPAPPAYIFVNRHFIPLYTILRCCLNSSQTSPCIYLYVDTTYIRQYNSMCRRSGGMADALRSGRSTRKGVRVQISPSAPFGACSSVGLERSPAKAEVVGSSPTKRTISPFIHIRTLDFNRYFFPYFVYLWYYLN